MTYTEMLDTMDSIIEFYRLIEREYGISLMREINHANQVKEDIPTAIHKAEGKDDK